MRLLNILLTILFTLFFLTSCQTAEEKREQAEKKLMREAEKEKQAKATERKIVRRLTDKCILDGYRKNTENLLRCVRVRKEDYMDELDKFKSRYRKYKMCMLSFCLGTYANADPRKPSKWNCGDNSVKKACGDKPLEPSL